MDIYNLITNRLEEKGFVQVHMTEIDNLGSAVYKSYINHVVLKKIHVEEQLIDLATYAFDIKNQLLDNGININNSYLFFCFDYDVDYETFFLIERDTVALRKYVILKENDLNRIPFLDDLKSEEKEFDFDNFNEDEFYLTELEEIINEKNGQMNKLNRNEINAVVKNFLIRIEAQNEN